MSAWRCIIRIVKRRAEDYVASEVACEKSILYFTLHHKKGQGAE